MNSSISPYFHFSSFITLIFDTTTDIKKYLHGFGLERKRVSVWTSTARGDTEESIIAQIFFIGPEGLIHILGSPAVGSNTGKIST